MPYALLSLALVAAGLLLLAQRRPHDARRALRQIGRRPARAALLACAMAPSTAILVGALGAVDTAAATARSIAVARSGGVDAVVVLNPLPPDPADRFDLATGNPFGGYPAAERGFFPEAEFARLAGATRGSATVAAIVPAIADDVAVLAGSGARPLGTVALLALAAPDAAASGPFLTPEGRPIELGSLQPDSVVVNAAAAGTLGIVPGAQLRLGLDHGPLAGWGVRVAAVAANGPIGGVQPAIFAPLGRVQDLIGRRGQLNHLLVAGRRDVGNVASPELAARELRWLLVDRAEADRLRAALARPEAQAALERAARSSGGRERERLLAVRSEARLPATTERFVGLVSELYLRKRLVALSGELRDAELRRAAFTSLTNLTALSVVERGDEGIAGAEAYARAATGGYLALGAVALGLATALTWTVSARPIARGRRGRVRHFFLGAFHALGGAAIGPLAGIGGLWAATALLAGPSGTVGIRPVPEIAPAAVAAGMAAGLGMSLLTVASVALLCGRRWAATRPLAADSGARALTAIPLASALALAAVVGAGWQRLLLGPTLVTCTLLGGAAVLRSLPQHLGAAGRAPRRAWLAPAAAAAAAGVWVQVLVSLPSAAATGRENIAAAILAGVAALLAGRWAVAIGLDEARAARGRAATPAPGRLAGAMAGIVTLAAVAALALGGSLAETFVAERRALAGFDLRVDPATAASDAASAGEAFARALRETAAGDRARIAGIGEIARADARVAADGAAGEWRAVPLGGVADDLLAGFAAPFIQRAPGLDSDAAVWAALGDRPDSAVISQQALRALPAAPGGAAPSLPFSLAIRLPGGDTGEVAVIGVIDPRAALDPGLYVARPWFDAAGATPTSTTWLIAARPGAATALAAALRPALERHGLAVATPNERQRVADAARAALDRSVLAFLALGLLASIAVAAGGARQRLAVAGLHVADVVLGVGLGFPLASALAAVLAAPATPGPFAFPWSSVLTILLLGSLGVAGALLRGGRSRPVPAT